MKDSIEGVEVKDRKKYGRTIKKCFVGKDAGAIGRITTKYKLYLQWIGSWREIWQKRGPRQRGYFKDYWKT